MTVQTFRYLPPTFGDVLAMRTGHLAYTIAAAVFYLLLFTLLLPGTARMWVGIAREAAVSMSRRMRHERPAPTTTDSPA